MTQRIGRSRQRPSVISLFAGAGGMDVALERAGWRTVTATDSDSDCVTTMVASREAHIPIMGGPCDTYLRGARIVRADIRGLNGADLRPARAGKAWRPTLLAGGPPCQPWSSAGLQRGLQDDRGQLISEMIRLTDELNPSLVLFENVRGLVTAVGRTGRPGEVLAWIKAEFENLGYATRFATLNAADFGAPQRRVRLYMLASRDVRLPAIPEPTHAKDPAQAPGRLPWVTLGEFLELLPPPYPEDVVRPNERRAAELATLMPGTGLRTQGRVENNRPSGHWGYRQDCFVADPLVPSRTIRAAATPDWIREPSGAHRRLTWRECAALQGFPPEWRFSGGAASRFRQIGNAVQTAMVEALGRALLASADGAREVPHSAPLPAEFHRRVRYTVAEHKTNGEHRVRVRASVR